MSIFELDRDQLASGLEDGIVESLSTHMNYGSIRPFILRTSLCGIVSVVIDIFLKSHGYESKMIISKPPLPWHIETPHIMNIVSENGKSVVVDGTYSQFLSWVGLTSGYAERSAVDYYPPDKIAVFDLEERQQFTAELTDYAETFRRGSALIRDEIFILGCDELPEYNSQNLTDLYGSIWNPEYFETLQLSPRAQIAGEQIAESLLLGDFA